MDRKALKKWLLANSTSAEREELLALDTEELNKKLDRVEERMGVLVKPEDMSQTKMELLTNIDGVKKQLGKMPERIQQSFADVAGAIVQEIGKLGGTITTSYEQNKPINTAGVYKDMINQLSAIDESIKNKPVPVWNWPQYASVSVRNKNFSNINPAIAPFGIGDYDEVVLTYSGSNLTVAVFKLSSTTIGTLTLTYDGSNNLTRVVRS